MLKSESRAAATASTLIWSLVFMINPWSVSGCDADGVALVDGQAAKMLLPGR